MTRLQLVIILMAVVAAIIIGLAAYVFSHLSGITLNEGIVLVVIAVIGLFLVMAIIILFLKNMNVRK